MDELNYAKEQVENCWFELINNQIVWAYEERRDIGATEKLGEPMTHEEVIWTMNRVFDDLRFLHAEVERLVVELKKMYKKFDNYPTPNDYGDLLNYMKERFPGVKDKQETNDAN